MNLWCEQTCCRQRREVFNPAASVRFLSVYSLRVSQFVSLFLSVSSLHPCDESSLLIPSKFTLFSPLGRLIKTKQKEGAVVLFDGRTVSPLRRPSDLPHSLLQSLAVGLVAANHRLPLLVLLLVEDPQEVAQLGDGEGVPLRRGADKQTLFIHAVRLSLFWTMKDCLLSPSFMVTEVSLRLFHYQKNNCIMCLSCYCCY